MFQTASHPAQGYGFQAPGPLRQFMHGDMGNMNHEMQRYAQHGREALMHSMSDMERMVEENATTLCVAGFLLGTFVDRRFLLLPLAVGGFKLYRSMQNR